MTVEESGLPHHLITIADGESALNYLNMARPGPDLMILDLNLPVLDGFQVLERLRQMDDGQFPVVVMSSSPAEGDRRHALELGAHCYFAKPSTLSGYKTLAQQLQVICAELASHPSRAVS
jgi:CheY-like chemotaxis protein